MHERQLADQQLRAFLVPPDLAQRHRARAEAVGFLGAAVGAAGGLGGQLLVWGEAARAFARGLLGAGHGSVAVAVAGLASRWPVLLGRDGIYDGGRPGLVPAGVQNDYKHVVVGNAHEFDGVI